MKSIEIVTHVFAGKIDAYAFHLLYQAASLLWYPPKADVTLTVFWAGAEHDPLTANVVEHIDKRRWEVNGRNVFNFVPIVLPREKLFRRAIGRHMVSQQSVADVIWYCDADMAFGEGCIDYVQGHIEDDGKLYGPGRVLINKDWQTGDAMVQMAGDWPRIHNDIGFKWQRNKVLIGGSQILGRETAKRLGYLGDQPKWQRPANPDKPFACFRDDSSWRRQHFPLEKQMQVKLDVPNVYRLRHSKSSIDPEGKRLDKCADGGTIAAMNIYADVFSMALTILVGLAGGVYGMVMQEYNLTLATGASPTSALARNLEDKRKFMSHVLLALLAIAAIVQFAL